MIQSKIVVIGGGFAAVKCARTLRKALPREYFSCFSSVKKWYFILCRRMSARMFHRLRISLLVAGCSALAKDPGWGSMRHDYLSGARRDPDYTASGRRRSPRG